MIDIFFYERKKKYYKRYLMENETNNGNEYIIITTMKYIKQNIITSFSNYSFKILFILSLHLFWFPLFVYTSMCVLCELCIKPKTLSSSHSVIQMPCYI